MRVSNILEFTESHRYMTFRDFSLGGMDRKSMAWLYQPMIGAFSAGLYHYLYHHLADDEAGYSAICPQRGLFLGLGLEPNASGRQALIDAASRLEAVGLLQVFRHYNPLSEEMIYEYVLLRPLGVAEFFSNLHLTLLLRDKIGKPAVLDLRKRFTHESPETLSGFVNKEEITVPFYELFRIGNGPVDPDLESAYKESAPSRERVQAPEKIRHAEMLLRFPRGSKNRRFVESLGKAPEQMVQINFLAYKYDLDVPEICRLLDEDGVFSGDGSLRWDELNRRAHSVYRQDRKREGDRERFLARLNSRDQTTESEPVTRPSFQGPSLLEVPAKFADEISQDRYNDFLRSEPYTRMLQRHFPGAVPDSFVRIFERIDLNYKLPEPVINVLIHYVLTMKDSQRLTHGFIDSIASNMLAKGIHTYELAAAYVIEQEKLNAALEKRRRGEDPGSSTTNSRGKPSRKKPAMPVVEDKGAAKELSSEERDRLLELARKLNEKS